MSYKIVSYVTQVVTHVAQEELFSVILTKEFVFLSVGLD